MGQEIRGPDGGGGRRARSPGSVAPVGSVAAQLRRAGVVHRALDGSKLPVWGPKYLPCSSSRFLWDHAPPPEVHEHVLDDGDRLKLIGELIAQQYLPDDTLLFVFDDNSLAIKIGREDALNALPILCQSRRTIWITSPPAQWMIEVADYVVRLALPPKLTAEEAAQLRARQMDLIGPITAALDASQTPYRIHMCDDPQAPRFPAGVMCDGRVLWQHAPTLLSGVSDRGDVEHLRQIIRDFLDTAETGASQIAVHIHHSEAPVVTLSQADFLNHLSAVMQAADRWEEPEGGEILSINDVMFHALPGRWLAHAYVQGRNWRIRVIGERG